MPTPERYPTLLPLAPTAFIVVVRAVTEVLRRFSWTKFNLLCDKNPDPLQIQAVEVMCSLMQNFVQAQARELIVVVNYFNSANPESYKNVIAQSKTHSTSTLRHI